MYIFSLEKKTDFDNRWTDKEILFWKKLCRRISSNLPRHPHLVIENRTPGFWYKISTLNLIYSYMNKFEERVH